MSIPSAPWGSLVSILTASEEEVLSRGAQLALGQPGLLGKSEGSLGYMSPLPKTRHFNIIKFLRRLFSDPAI